MMSLAEYLELSYTIVLKKDEDGDFVARIKELKGCVAHGPTEAEALAALQSMKILWFESCIADGSEIPLPEEESDLPSGKWLQRAPRSLHAALVCVAEEDGVSLNQFVVSVLAREIGVREGKKVAGLCIHGSTPSVSDPWAQLTEMTGNWHVDRTLPVRSLDMSFIDTFASSTGRKGKHEEIGWVSHGKDKEDKYWN